MAKLIRRNFRGRLVPKGITLTRTIPVKRSTLDRLMDCIPGGQKLTWDGIVLMAVEALEREKHRAK